MTLNFLVETGWISALILTLTFVRKSFYGCTNDILEFTCELNQVRHFKKVLVELPVRFHVGFIDGQVSSKTFLRRNFADRMDDLPKIVNHIFTDTNILWRELIIVILDTLKNQFESLRIDREFDGKCITRNFNRDDRVIEVAHKT